MPELGFTTYGRGPLHVLVLHDIAPVRTSTTRISTNESYSMVGNILKTILNVQTIR